MAAPKMEHKKNRRVKRPFNTSVRLMRALVKQRDYSRAALIFEREE
jgi:hypothetical protein